MIAKIKAWLYDWVMVEGYTVRAETRDQRLIVDVVLEKEEAVAVYDRHMDSFHHYKSIKLTKNYSNGSSVTMRKWVSGHQ